MQFNDAHYSQPSGPFWALYSAKERPFENTEQRKSSSSAEKSARELSDAPLFLNVVS